MPPTRHYIGFFFGALAAIFLFLALRRSGGHAPAAKAYVRIGLIFAAVCLYLLLNQRF
jgi:hypothetical protein